MGTKIQVDTITNVTNSSGLAVMNANDQELADEFDEVLYRDGSQTMQGDLDMDSNRIINLPDATNGSEPVTLGQIGDILSSNPSGDVLVEALARIAADALIRSDFSSAASSLGAGLVGFSHSASYAAGTLGKREQQYVSVKDAPYSAAGDGVTDDTTAIQAAINAVSSAGGGILIFPRGTYNYTALTTSSSEITPLAFMGYGAILKKINATGTGLLIQGAAGAGGPSGVKRQGCLIQGLRFTHSVTQTAGETIKIVNAEHTVVRDIRIESPYGGLLVQDAFDTHIHGDIYIRNSVAYDMKLQGTGTTPTCIDVFFSNILGEGTAGNVTKTGLIIDSGVSGVYAVNSDFAQGTVGINVQNTVVGGVRAEYLFFTSILSDSTASSGWLINADCKGLYYNDCWASTAAGTGSGFELSNGTGHMFTNCKAYNNSRHGINITGAAEVHITGGQYSGNSTSVANTYNGINVIAGASGFSVVGARSGNISGLGGGTQQYGIEVAAGASDNYRILDNDVRGNGASAGISDGGTGVSKRLHNNLGWNPRGYLGAVTVPASTVTQNNTFGVDATVYVSGGTVTVIEINAGPGFVTTGVTSGPIRVPAGAQIRLTYSVVPTWVWFGD